jgi:hypothetical protein
MNRAVLLLDTTRREGGAKASAANAKMATTAMVLAKIIVASAKNGLCQNHGTFK